MQRREFIGLVGGALVSPVSALAQNPLPVIGFLTAFAESGLPEPFLKGLREVGYVEGRSVAFVGRRAAAGDYDQLRVLADELVRLRVSVIVAWGHPAALAAKAATSTLPIVFWTAGDPVADGLVASMRRPGGNLTGVAFLNNALGAKRLELLRQLLPDATVFGLLANPSHPAGEVQLKDAQQAARTAGVQLQVASARTENEIEKAFATLTAQRAEGLLVMGDPFLFSRRERILALAAQHRIATVYTVRAYCVDGGLISYASAEPLHEELGRYTGLVLKGEKPADLPVQQSTRFDLVINLKTAKSLGLSVPPTLLAQANEVIE